MRKLYTIHALIIYLQQPIKVMSLQYNYLETAYWVTLNIQLGL